MLSKFLNPREAIVNLIIKNINLLGCFNFIELFRYQKNFDIVGGGFEETPQVSFKLTTKSDK